MGKEERARRKAALLAKAKKKEAENKGPPQDRISISGTTFLGSDANEWMMALGLGWYHSSEAGWLGSNYIVCCETHRYISIREAVETIGGEFVGRAQIGKTWVQPYGGRRAIPMAGAVAAKDEQGTNIWVSKDWAAREGNLLQCSITGFRYPVRTASRIRYPLDPDIQVISQHAAALFPDRFCVCPRCAAVAEKPGVKRQPEVEGAICCNDCLNTHVNKNIIHVHNYDGYPAKLSSNPKLKLVVVGGAFKEVPDESHRLYGVECEVEIHDDSPLTRWQLATNATKALGRDFIVMKNDGSLKGHERESPLWGFEMVSAPADIATHEARWSKLEKMEGFKYLRAWDTITCGMHVHVGKSALSLLQVGRIMVFINNPANKKFIEKVAGRNSEAASRFIGEKTFGDGMRPDRNKYCALNIIPVNTIEFRIFRGTIRYKHIMRNLEFVDAVCSYCYPAARSLLDIKDHKQFILFVRRWRKKWPRLAEWMEDRKLLPQRKLPPGAVKEEVVEPEPVIKESAKAWYAV